MRPDAPLTEAEKAGSGRAPEADYRPAIPMPEPYQIPPVPGLPDPDLLTEYRLPDGGLAFVVCRWNEGTAGLKKKQIKPLTHDGTRERWKGMPGPGRPLLNAPQLVAHPTAPVLIVEGEKTATAAPKYLPDGWIVTTWHGGAQAWQQTDLSILKEHRCVIWMDNDQPGCTAATALGAHLRENGIPVAIIPLIESWPAKWDLADPLPEGITPEQVTAKILRAAEKATCPAKPAPPPIPAALPPAPKEADPEEVDDLDLLPEYADESLALIFTKRFADRLRYVAKFGRWYVYNETHWRADETMAVFDLARSVCRSESIRASENQESPTTRKKIVAANTIANVERLTRADRRHAATSDTFDRDPMLLNTPGGTVDLRTGEMREHRSDDLLSKITAVAPASEATAARSDRGAPIFFAFLNEITAGDTTLQAFIQREFGYAMTGLTREQCLFFHHGTGANGKGVLLNTLRTILGTYAAVADMAAFTATKNDRHPTDIAGLWGARAVFAQETEEGRAWAEARVKAITGGDPISARFMRQDFFEFTPTFKLIIAGNHRPQIRNLDEAMRRRFNLVPHTVTIPKERRDKDLEAKLRPEHPAILRWAIDGCLAWQKDGINAPAAVRAATDEYFTTEDAVGRWLEERVTVDAHGTSTRERIYKSWRQYAEANGEFVGSQKKLTQTLAARPELVGVDWSWRHPQTRERGAKGFSVKVDSPPPSNWELEP